MLAIFIILILQESRVNDECRQNPECLQAQKILDQIDQIYEQEIIVTQERIQLRKLSKSALPALVSRARESEGKVSEIIATELLERCSSPEVYDLLRNITFSDQNTIKRSYAITSMFKINSEKSTEIIKEGYGSFKDPYVIRSIMRALGNCPSHDALNILKEGIKNPSRYVRGDAADSLCFGFRADQSLPILREAYEIEEDHFLKLMLEETIEMIKKYNK